MFSLQQDQRKKGRRTPARSAQGRGQGGEGATNNVYTVSECKNDKIK
jgi:hypothetical protein